MNSTYWVDYIMSEIYTRSILNFYIGLSSTAPNDDGSNITEPNGSGYSRVPVGEISSPINGIVTNLTDITFPKSSGEWFSSENKASYYVIFDGLGSDAHYLTSEEFNSPRSIDENVQIKIIARSLRIVLTDLPKGVIIKHEIDKI